MSNESRDPTWATSMGGFEMFSLQGDPHLVGPIETPFLVSWFELRILHVAQSNAGVCPGLSLLAAEARHGRRLFHPRRCLALVEIVH
jgi:hypothetical protein